jgi:Mlc titration factor MtfA (ptsG expression regulator)
MTVQCESWLWTKLLQILQLLENLTQARLPRVLQAIMHLITQCGEYMFLESQASTIIDTKELVSCQGFELISRFNILKKIQFK